MSPKTSPRRRNGSLTPDGPPPEKGAQWCPTCQNWTLREVQYAVPERTYPPPTLLGAPLVVPGFTVYKPRPKRCAACRTALVRPPKILKPKPGELRPGVVAMW